MPGQVVYKNVRYQRARQVALRRDKYLCQECRRFGRTVEATTTHHIKHVEDNPELAFKASNLISLCAKCHNKQHPEKGGRRYPPT